MDKSIRNVTDIEKIMQDELEKRKLEFRPEFPTRSGFLLDFAFIKEKLGIECDGEFWHNKKRDSYRDLILKRGGWKIMRFPGKQIKDNIEQCVDEVVIELHKRSV